TRMKRQQIISHSSRLVFFLLFAFSISCAQTKSNSGSPAAIHADGATDLKIDTATFAAGCFWCVEEQFKQLEGVTAVISGYTGGRVRNPTYTQVTTGRT